MKKITTYLCSLTLIVSINAYGQKTWTGATSKAWNTSTNWTPAGAPASTDDVIIPSAPANQPLISGTITPVCKNLTINSGASLNISATTTNNALLTASGNATINGALSIVGTPLRTGKLVVVNITWGSTASMTGTLNTSMDVAGNWEFSTGSAISMGFCGVNFTGSTNTLIISKSAASSFYAVTINKNSGNTIDIASTSTATLNFGSTVTINTGSTLLCHATNTIVFSNSLYNTGHFSFGTGTVSFEKTSGTQIIQVNTSDLFNNMIINSGGTVTINNTLNILNDLTINSGIFDPLGYMVILFGDWDNNVGPDSFTEGTSRVIFSGGNYHQYSSTENFNILEVNKSIGGAFRVNTGTVTCNQYDWTAGSIDVLNNGTFTALDLADQGIRGNYYVNTGCTINLYQDASQYVDLGGNLTFTSGGTINVYGGNGTVSQWPTYANASITMDGGILDFKDQSITINTLSGYTLTTNVTGGIIRTSRSFFNNRTDFNPTGGTVELYGSVNSGIDFINGSVWNLEIDKDVASSVTLNTNLTINGNLTVNSGTISYVNKVLTLANTLNINSGGVFNLGMAGQLKLASGKYLNVNSGGLLKTEGTGADNAIITHSAGYYFISVKNGGIISANNTYFTYLNYIQLQSGSTLDPANAFYRCTFTNNAAAPLAAVLSFANDQVVSIHEANFVALNSGYNVLKSNDAGHVYFKDATGAFAGATYENDPYNLIDWVASTPGLWTGATSSDWHTASNWDDYNVPTASTDVTIPEDSDHYPVIGAGNAYCNNLIIMYIATLTQNAGSSFFVSGDFDAYDGQFNMDGASYLYFSGTAQTLWISGNNDDYTNIRILKNVNTASVQLVVGSFVFCSGTFEIREGVFHMGGYLDVANPGTSAFEVEDGGKLIRHGQILVSGYVHFFNGSIYEDAGIQYFSVGKDFIADEAALGGQISALKMIGSGTQYIDIKPGSNFTVGILQINKNDGVCYIKSDDIIVDDYVKVEAGTFSAYDGPSYSTSFNIYLSGFWDNEPGATFEPGLGKVVCTSDKPAYCKNVEFNILEVDKTTNMMEIHENVTCAAYNWTSGTVKVINGATFTANDLLDNAIKGSFICEEGGTINLTNSGTGTFVDLAGELHNLGGTINISGSISYWPYGGNAIVEMTGGVIDLKTCGLTIDNTATYSLTDNITSGTIRTVYGFAGNRADFTPAGGTFEFYGTSDYTISQMNGCTLNDVVINKTAKNDGEKVILGPVIDKRSGQLLSDGGKSNTISLGSDFTISGNLDINAGTFNPNIYTCAVSEVTTINNATLAMTQASANITSDAIIWNSGSMDNITAGEIHVNDWWFMDGTDAMLGVGNTVFVTSWISGNDSDAEFGNLTLIPADKGSFDLEAEFSIRVAGNYTIKNGVTVNNSIDNYISGIFNIEAGGNFQNSNSKTIFIDSTPFTLNGKLNLGNGHLFCHNGFTLAASGELIISGGSLIMDAPFNAYDPWQNFDGILNLINGIIEMSHNGFEFGPSSINNISGGAIRSGFAFKAITPNTFQPAGGAVELISAETGGSINCIESNYFHNLIINKATGTTSFLSGYPVTVKNDLTIQSGCLNSNGYDIYIEGDWNNLVGPDGFVEGTGRVVFNGVGIFQYCSTEEFNILEVDRPDGWSLWNLPGASISCQQYDWTQGGISLYETNGHFYAADLIDDGIQGYFAIGDNCSIELHQDVSQSVDLMANLHITGGEFKVYGGNDQSQWGENGNASLYMVGGILYFVDQAIVIQDLNPYSFTSNISGGTIRTRSFIAQSPGFDPTGGTVEIYGDNNGQVVASSGAYFHDLKINTDPMPFYTNIYSCNINNDLIIEEGSVTIVFGNTMQCGNVIINSGGDLRVNSSTLKMKNNGTVNVNSGGFLILEGYEGAKSTVTGINSTDRYQFNVNTGCMITPGYTVFENMNMQGINIASGATVIEWQPFYNCEFRNGSASGTLLNFNNDQDLMIENAVFPTNTWGGSYNVSKGNNAGNVTFLGATGGFAGEAFENDPYNRIHWTEVTNYLDLKVWLEGPFNNTDMNTNLTGLSNFPLNQPYNVYPWNYAGTESVTTVPGNVVDWVLVELRDAPTAAQATSATRIARMAAFLKKDGSIVGIDGTSLLEFSNSITNQLFVVIWHRNHIEIMSAIPLVKVGETYAYDFRTDVTKVYGGGVGYKDLGAGIAVMVGADGNADGNINNLDKIGQWNPNAGKKGYLSSDFNMDSQVNNIDKNNCWWPNEDEGFNSQVPE